MNNKIASMLAAHLINLPFLTVTAGLVQELSIAVPNGTKGTKVKKIPAVRTIYTKPVTTGGAFNGSFNLSFSTGGATQNTCEKIDDYFDLIPKTKETGILYFEDLGTKLVKEDIRKSEYTSTMNLVCWLNMKKIGDNYDIGDFIAATIAQIPMQLTHSEFIIGGRVKCEGVLPNRPSPFVKYDYNEAEKQFITHPFDYFSLRITASVLINKMCGVNITLNPETC